MAQSADLESMSPRFTITALTREFDVTPRALRFYESEGLLNPERRGQARLYSARDRARLSLILRGKRLGFSLRVITTNAAMAMIVFHFRRRGPLPRSAP